MLPDADVRTLLADEQLRDTNVETLRRYDQVRRGITLSFVRKGSADARPFGAVVPRG